LNGDRGLAVVEAISNAGHGLLAVVTPPDKKEILAQRIDGMGIDVWPTGDINDRGFVDKLRSLDTELLAIAGYSTILRADILSVARHGNINLHGGRLPSYRGGSPLNWQIINGETSIGISVLRVDEGIDTGDILAECSFDLGPDDDIAKVHSRANSLFPDLVLQVLSRFDGGEFDGTPQRPDEGYYWHQRNESDGHIHWSGMNAQEVHNLVRAITRPYPGAFCYSGHDKVRLLRTELPAMQVRGVPGRVCFLQGRGPYVVCREGAVLVTEHAIEGVKNGRLRHGAHLR